jgi:hypothetical protein
MYTNLDDAWYFKVDWPDKYPNWHVYEQRVAWRNRAKDAARRFNFELGLIRERPESAEKVECLKKLGKAPDIETPIGLFAWVRKQLLTPSVAVWANLEAQARVKELEKVGKVLKDKREGKGGLEGLLWTDGKLNIMVPVIIGAVSLLGLGIYLFAKRPPGNKVKLAGVRGN